MLEIEEVTKKHSRTYKCPDAIENFRIRVRIREASKDVEEVKVFRWQEKKHGRFAREFYKDSNNCVTPQEKKYHEDVKDMPETEDLVFSYVEEDCVNPEEHNIPVSCLTKVKHQQAAPTSKTAYNYETSLTDAMSGVALENNCESMFIMADFGEYYEETWLKCEYVLCSLRYDASKKSLVVYPDYSIGQPYVIKINTDTSRKIEFWLENASLDGVTRKELMEEAEIVNKVSLYESKVRLDKVGSDFKMVKSGRLQVYVLVEIRAARGFSGSNLYVQYYVDLPDNWVCHDEEALKGSTACCRTDGRDAYFGCCVELELEYNLAAMKSGEQFQAPRLYFEVISKGSWSRFRSDGLAHQRIPINMPGSHHIQLQCLRLLPDSNVGNLRRFFIGDSGNCDDVTWIGIPKNHQSPVINKFGSSTTSAGTLELQLRVLHQGQPTDSGISRERLLLEKLTDPNLLRSVEHVLEAFRGARGRMLEARSRCK